MAIDFEFESRIVAALRSDRQRLRNRLRSIRRAQRAGQPCDHNLADFAAALERSIALREWRRQAAPSVSFPQNLPISERRQAIADAIANHQVVVVSGETGSGKSTQLPKICLDLGRGVDGLIGHTQPRRIAARSIAARIAEELATPLGQAIGYKIRFSDATSERTYIKLMTDGILLAESQQDRFLNQYDTLILDEAHERSLNIDFLLGYLRRILPRRPDLKLIITSATIDADRFASFFAAAGRPAPVLEVAGRTYPVEIRYRPPANEPDDDPLAATLAAVDEVAGIDAGDILIFMPTELEIHELAKRLRGRALPGDVPSCPTEIVPLYARLPTRDQQRIFLPHSGRRIVIATNVAESSLTAPGIRYVIDAGTARISRYASRSRSQRLPIEPISQASADQRAGRCGRVGPGVCIRLYSAEDYAARLRFTPPEIQRSNLAGVILQALALGLGAIEDFPLLDQPRPDAVRDGYATLFELGAITADRQLTDIGRAMARLPVDPRLGRLILAGDQEQCLEEVLVIAAALATQDPRERPHDRREAADLAHAQWADPESDFLGYWNLWLFLRDLKAQLSRSQFQRICEANFLSPARVREWQEARRQLAREAAQAGMRAGPPRRDRRDAIARSVLTAFLSNVGRRTVLKPARPHSSAGGRPGGSAELGAGRAIAEFEMTGSRAARLWPGSGLGQRPPKWIVASEVVETHRRHLRTVGRIQRAWIEELAPHLVSRSYQDPRWEPAQAAAVVLENVSLFGLRLVQGRQTALARVDAELAREIFLWSGLVRGGYATRAKFMAHNRELLARMEQLERRSRRKGLVLGEEARFAFYQARVPREVVDGRTFEAWRRRAEQAEPRMLFMRERDLTRNFGEPLDPADFPDALFIRSLRAPLEYAFEPGSPRDGVTVSIPRDAFRQLDPQRLEWLVPGLLADKIAALLKTLDKDLRRRLIPLAGAARTIASLVGYGDGSLLWSVAREAGKLAGESIPPGAFHPARLPAFLQMRVRVVDAEGRTLAAGRDLSQVRRELRAAAGLAAPQSVDEVYLDGALWNRDGIVEWDFGELPDEILLPEEHATLVGFPAVVDQGDSVALELMPCPELAARESRRGVRRLAALAYQPALVAQVEWLPDLRQIARDAAPWLDERSLRAELVALLADWTFFPQVPAAPPGSALAADPGPRDPESFVRFLAVGRQRLGWAAQELTEFAGPLFQACQQVRQRLAAATDPAWKYAVAELGEQLAQLLCPGFLSITPRRFLVQYPRYLQAMVSRLDRLSAGQLERDEAQFAIIHPRWRNLLELLADQRAEGRFHLELEAYRWLLEEYRARVFGPTDAAGARPALTRECLDAHWSRLRFE